MNTKILTFYTMIEKIFYIIVGLLLKIVGVIIVYYSMSSLLIETWNSNDLEFLDKVLRMTIFLVGAYFGAKVYCWSNDYFYILHIELENSDIDIYI